MIRRSVNKLRNGALAWSGGKLKAWTVRGASYRARIMSLPENRRGVRLVSTAPGGEVFVEQRFRAREGKHFRVEAVLRGELSGSRLRPADRPPTGIGSGQGGEDCGGVLMVQALDRRGRLIDERVTEPILVARSPERLRAYYLTPEGTANLCFRAGVRRARGMLDVLEAAVIPILEPEWRSHALAIPPPSFVDRPVRDVRRVGLVVADPGRPLVAVLRAMLDEREGRPALEVLSERVGRKSCERLDAIFFAEDRLPREWASLAGLLRLAEGRVVVTSLAALASVSRGAMRVRTVEQPDDPMHAVVTYAGPATRGFALSDGFPFSWSGPAPGSFVLRQVTRTAAFKQFCRRWGFAPLLRSLCNTESTSERVIGLVKETGRGALYALDLFPLEAPPCTMQDSQPLMIVLLNLLGLGGGAGQFAVPLATEAEFRALIREMPVRFRGCRVIEADVPASEVRHQILTFEPQRLPESVRMAASRFDRPAPEPGLVVVRSGLTSGDLESVYAAWTFFKQLVRMPPYACPYAEVLLSQLRLAWQPLAAAWEASGGWRRRSSPARPVALTGMRAFFASGGCRLTALIDVVSSPTERVRVIGADFERHGARVVTWLPRLWQSFGPAPLFGRSAPAGRGRADRDAVGWRWTAPEVEITEGCEGFDDPAHEDARRAGAVTWRVEIPGGDADFVARSIERTAIGATLLEHLIGLHFGMVAVNRRPQPVEFPPFAPVSPGEALMVPASRVFPQSAAESA